MRILREVGRAATPDRRAFQCAFTRRSARICRQLHAVVHSYVKVCAQLSAQLRPDTRSYAELRSDRRAVTRSYSQLRAVTRSYTQLLPDTRSYAQLGEFTRSWAVVTPKRTRSSMRCYGQMGAQLRVVTHS